MLINSIDIKTFNAKVETKMFDHASDNETGLGALFIRLLFTGENRDDVHKNISDFLSQNMKECIIKFNNLTNFFTATYVDHSIEETEFDEYLFLEIEFDAFQFGAEITKTFTSQSTFKVEGNKETDIYIAITPRIALIDCILSGVSEEPILIKNLKANKAVILDGISGLALEDNKNKFCEVELWEFPKLKPGNNTVSVNKENVSIEIKYTPKWR